MLRIPLDHHRPGSDGITVDVDGDGYVSLSIDPDAGETLDDRTFNRNLLAGEARALAAALWHFAAEAER